MLGYTTSLDPMWERGTYFCTFVVRRLVLNLFLVTHTLLYRTDDEMTNQHHITIREVDGTESVSQSLINDNSFAAFPFL